MQMNLISTLICIALMSGIGVATRVSAGDLPRRDQVSGPAFTQAGNQINWQGFYIGANTGYGFGRARNADVDGFLIGGHAGYNVQMDRVVAGIEGDIGYTGIDYRGFTDVFQQKWMGSLRGRIGYSYERFLPYLTAGLGYTTGKLKDVTGKVENTHIGFVIGAGAEMMVTSNVAARVEFLHYNFGSESYALPSGTRNVKPNTNVLRFGLSYKF